MKDEDSDFVRDEVARLLKPRSFYKRDGQELGIAPGISHRAHDKHLLPTAVLEVMACRNCHRVWERDCNAALNITLKATLICKQSELPACWQKIGLIEPRQP